MTSTQKANFGAIYCWQYLINVIRNKKCYEEESKNYIADIYIFLQLLVRISERMDKYKASKPMCVVCTCMVCLLLFIFENMPKYPNNTKCENRGLRINRKYQIPQISIYSPPPTPN